MDDLYKALDYEKPPRRYIPTKDELVADVLSFYHVNCLFNKTEYRLKGKFSLCDIENYFGSWTQMLSELGISRSSQDSWLNYFEKFFNVPLKKEKTFNTCINPNTGKKLRFDGYSPDYNFLIEYQDASHYMDLPQFNGHDNLAERQFKDKIKREWAEENNIPLYIVNYFDEPFSRNYLIEKFSFLSPSDNQNKNFVQRKFYWGVHKYKNSYIATVYNGNGSTRAIFQCKDELKCALYREGYIITNSVGSRRNDLSLEQLQKYGLDAWSEYEKLKKIINHYDSPYIGVNKTHYGWRSTVKVSGKMIVLLDVPFDDPKVCALYRTGYILTHSLSNEYDFFNDNVYKQYGVNSYLEYEKLKFLR